MNNITLALESLLTRYVNQFQDSNSFRLPSVCFDPPWPSPCVKHADEEHQYWSPRAKNDFSIFEPLENALERTFHPDFVAFYASFWSNGICVEREDINFALIQTWNKEDQEQLKENLLGHAFMKLRAKQPLSLFIGCTFGDEIICIDNESGHIVLERPGRKAHKVFADNLESFLISLSPTMDVYDI